MKKKNILFLIVLAFISARAMAYLGKPCNPETDFKYVYLIKNWKQLPAKNQEETLAQVNWVNKMVGKKVWKYNPKPNRPIWACLSYGASTVADWWAIELGRKLKSYKSLVNGNIEHGFNPRKLEAIYIKRSKKHFKTYWTVPWLGIVRKLPSPVNPVGYAKILTDRKSEEVMDPTIPGVRFNLKPNDYPMEHMWKSVFDGKKKHKTSLLIDAIRNHGPVLSQLELDHARFLPGAHTPAIIGYGILKKGFPKRVVFIVHDSYGDHPKDYKQDARGGSLYRYVPSKMIDEAIVFPHVVRVSYKTVSNQLVLAFHNSGNVPVKVNKVMLKDKSGKIINLTIRKRKSKLVVPFSKLPGNFNTSSFIVYVDADYYRGKDGNGYWIKPKKL